MTEDGLFVDNPLELGGMFGKGIFLVPDFTENRMVYHGQGSLKILHVFYYDQREIPAAAFQLLSKLMGALKWKGKTLTTEDYASINAAAVHSEDRLLSIMEDFAPEKLFIWSDDWFSQQPAPSFYISSSINGVEVLRCHSPETMMADEERKRECWLSIKRFFGVA